MKNIWKKIGIWSCAIALTFSLAACNQSESAYDIAKKNGFTGTEAEWIASLKGVDGMDAPKIDINDVYEAAKANGYEGTFLQFLKEYLQLDIKECNDTEQIAKNAMSVVSIACGFERVVEESTFWGTTQTKEKYASAGSGVIVKLDKEAGDAYIVTNFHVVYDYENNTATHVSESIYAYTYGASCLYSKEEMKDLGTDGMKASYVGGSMLYDIAVLKITDNEILKKSAVTVAEIGDSDKIEVGESVYVIGNPGNKGISLTSGLISVTSEYITLTKEDNSDEAVKHRVLRTDAAINSGNSGGAMFDAYGKLIGIVNAKNVQSTVDNIGYAIPVSLAKAVWTNIMENNGGVQRAMLGVTIQKTATQSSLVNGKIETVDTVVVSEAAISPTSIAYQKLRYGDVLKALKIKKSTGEEINYSLTRFHHLEDAMLSVRKGDTVVLSIERDGTPSEKTFEYNDDKYFSLYE